MTKGKKYYFRIVIAVLLAALILIKVDFTETGSFFKNLGPVSIFFVFLISFILILISSYKWKIFLADLGLPLPISRLFNYYIIGYFFNNFLPSNFGGDAVRFLFTTRGKGTYSNSFVAVFMERFTGLITLILFLIISFPLAFYQFNFLSAIKYLLPPFFIITSFTGFVFLGNPVYLKRYTFSNRILSKVYERIFKIMITIQSFRDKRHILISTLSLSILFNIFAVLNVYIVSWALGITISLYSLFIFVPFILIISAIPLSINGIGIVEGAYVLCLTQAGISSPAALSIALLMRGKNIVLSLVGGVLLVFYRSRDPVFRSNVSTESQYKV